MSARPINLSVKSFDVAFSTLFIHCINKEPLSSDKRTHIIYQAKSIRTLPVCKWYVDYVCKHLSFTSV